MHLRYLMRYILTFNLLIISLVFCQPGCAGVYHCVGNSGVVELRDSPCQPGTEESFLPYRYNKTDLKQAESQEKIKAQAKGQAKGQEKKEIRLQNRLRKQAEKEALKTKRREARCLKAQEHIKALKTQLRLGCKQHRCQRLRTKLRHYETMEQRHCSILAPQ